MNLLTIWRNIHLSEYPQFTDLEDRMYSASELKQLGLYDIILSDMQQWELDTSNLPQYDDIDENMPLQEYILDVVNDMLAQGTLKIIKAYLAYYDDSYTEGYDYDATVNIDLDQLYQDFVDFN